MMGVIWLPPIFFLINCYIDNIWEDTPDRHLARWQGLRTCRAAKLVEKSGIRRSEDRDSHDRPITRDRK